MDYLVEFIITIPDDAPPAEIEKRLAGRDDARRRARRAGARPARLEAAARGRAATGPRPVPRGIRRGAGGDPRLAAAASLDGDLGDGAGRAPQ